VRSSPASTDVRAGRGEGGAPGTEQRPSAAHGGEQCVADTCLWREDQEQSRCPHCSLWRTLP